MNLTINEKTQSNISLIAAITSIVMNIAIGFFISPVIVRDLGVEANGFAQLANNFVSYASLFTVALNAMAARYVAVSYHKGEKEKASGYYSSALVGNILIILALLVPAILLVANIDKVVIVKTTNVDDVKLLFTFVFLNFFISNIYNVFNISTTVKNRHYLSSCITMIGAVIRIGILFILFRYFEVKVYFVSFAALVVSAVSLFEYYLVKKGLIEEIKIKKRLFKFETIKELVSSGIWNTVNKCGELMMTGFDLLMTNLFIGPVQMGVMSVAKTIPTHLISISATISWNWHPKMTREYAEGNTKQMLDTLDYSAKLTSMITSLPIMIFCVYSKAFYGLWMPTQNADTLAVLSVLSMFSYIFLSGSSCVYNFFIIYDRLKVNAISYLVGAVISIVTSYFCVRYTDLGIYAVAGISSCVIVLRNLCFLLPYAAKFVGLKWYSFYKYVLYNVACSGIVGIVSYAVKSLFSLTNWFAFILACAISLLCAVIAFALLLTSKNQKRKFMSLIKNKLLWGKGA